MSKIALFTKEEALNKAFAIAKILRERFESEYNSRQRVIVRRDEKGAAAFYEDSPSDGPVIEVKLIEIPITYGSGFALFAEYDCGDYAGIVPEGFTGEGFIGDATFNSLIPFGAA